MDTAHGFLSSVSLTVMGIFTESPGFASGSFMVTGFFWSVATWHGNKCLEQERQKRRLSELERRINEMNGP